jgi:DNA-binding MarR family transcriptional regulator
MTWAWRQVTESSGQRLVLLALADHCGGDEDDPGRCWPSAKVVAAKCGMQPNTVHKHIERLAEVGLLAKVERVRRSDGTLGAWVVSLQLHSRASGTPVR